MYLAEFHKSALRGFEALRVLWQEKVDDALGQRVDCQFGNGHQIVA